MKKILMLLIMFLYLSPFLVHAAEPPQEDVDIVEFIECKWYNLWCQVKKSVINSAYESQESQYISLQTIIGGAELIKTENFDDLIVELNLFMLDMLALYFQIRASFLLFRMMFSGGDVYETSKTKDEFMNIIKSILLITILPMLIIIANDFFIQTNQVFMSNNDFAAVVLQDYSANDSFIGFKFNTSFNGFLVFLVTGFSLFFKLFIYMGPVLMGLVGALWFGAHKYTARLFLKLLTLSYLHVPILIIVFNMVNAMYESNLDIGATFALFLLLMIYFFMTLSIFIINLTNRIAHIISDRTREGFMKSTEAFSGHMKRVEEADHKESRRNSKLKEQLKEAHEHIDSIKGTVVAKDTHAHHDSSFDDIMHKRKSQINPKK